MSTLWPRRSTTAAQRGITDIERMITRTPTDHSLPYAMSPPVSADDARQRVKQLVDGLLPDGVDEGTGAALDRLITSWVAGWLAGIDAQHADRTAAIDQLIGAARERVADARAEHDHLAFRLETARQDERDARLRLGGAPSPAQRDSDTDRTGELR